MAKRFLKKNNRESRFRRDFFDSVRVFPIYSNTRPYLQYRIFNFCSCPEICAADNAFQSIEQRAFCVESILSRKVRAVSTGAVLEPNSGDACASSIAVSLACLGRGPRITKKNKKIIRTLTMDPNFREKLNAKDGLDERYFQYPPSYPT